MARTAALGDGPVVFFSEGVQVEVPLSAIYFENDEVGTTRTDLVGLDKWIKFLASRKRLVPGDAAPVARAVVVRAASAGSAGNNIRMTVARKTDTTVDITVTETDRYDGLTLATIIGQLGRKNGEPGARPGLLWVSAAIPASAPEPVANANVTAGGSATVPVWRINAGTTSASAVNLEARRNEPAAAFLASDFTVAVSNVVPAPAGQTGARFTLTVTWTRTVRDVAVTNANLPTTLDALGYVVAFSLPAGTATFSKLPRPGTFTLTGGSETVTVPAAPAAVTIMAPE
jgi:hypothetical protein